MTKYLLFILFTLHFLLFPVQVLPEEPELENFAYGYEIMTEGGAPIFRLPLPEKIYQTVTRPDLGDIRMFNRHGQRIPFAISRQKTNQNTETYWVNLPFFPLRGNVEQFNRNLIDIKVNDNGKIIDIRYKDETDVPKNQAIESYIIDLSNVKHNIDQLSFIIAGGEGGYLKKAFIEKSDDLNSWSMLVDSATLSRLNYANHTLEKNNINIPNQKINYLRFTWRDNSEDLKIKSVRALLTTTSVEKAHKVSIVSGSRSEDDSNRFIYDLGGNYPVDQVNVLLPDTNMLIEAAVQSRNDPESTWNTHFTGLFYLLTMHGTDLSRQPVKVGPTSNRYWQVDVKTDDGIGTELPKLQVAWVPHDLYFLARGEGPYTLAFGSSRVAAPDKPVNSLMAVLSDEQQQSLVKVAEVGALHTLRGPQALVPVKVFPWRQIALWIILVSAVIIIGVIARKLYREMNQMQ